MSKLVKGFILAGVLAVSAGYALTCINDVGQASASEGTSHGVPVKNSFYATPPQLAASSKKLSVTKLRLSESNTIVFRSDFNAMSVAQLQQELLDKDAKLGRGKPLYVVLDTPGGSIDAGNQFIDLARSLNRPVNTVTIFAASMGFNTVQRLGTRYILPSGTLMAHRARVAGVSGQVPGEFITAAANILRLVTKMEKNNADRLHISMDQYTQLVKDEYWVDGEDAVRQGAADELASISCDDSLSGTTAQPIMTLFGPVELVWSKCPAITLPLGLNFQGDQDDLEELKESLGDYKQFRKTLVKESVL